MFIAERFFMPCPPPPPPARAQALASPGQPQLRPGGPAAPIGGRRGRSRRCRSVVRWQLAWDMEAGVGDALDWAFVCQLLDNTASGA